MINTAAFPAYPLTVSNFINSNIDYSVICKDEEGSISIHQNGEVTFNDNYAGALLIFMNLIRNNMNKGLNFLTIHECIEICLDDGPDINLKFKKGEPPESLQRLQRAINCIENLKVFFLKVF